VGDLKQVTVNYQSIHGLIQTDWKKSIDFELNLQIPVNTRATVEIPATLKNLVFESGKSLGKIAHLKILERTSEKLIVSIGSGAYHFKVKQP
jgi:alpha-L-rhamnosidase